MELHPRPVYDIVLTTNADLIEWITKLNPRIYSVFKYTTNKCQLENNSSVSTGKNMVPAAFLQYVIDNYEKLPEKTAFVQEEEYSWRHQGSIIDRIQESMDKECTFMNLDYFRLGNTYYQYREMMIQEFYGPYLKPYLGSHESFHEWQRKKIGCTQFVVHKNEILSKPKKMYQDIYQWLVESTFEKTTYEPELKAKFLEWTWDLLFQKPLLYLEQNCELVSVRGIASACDKKPERDIRSDAKNFTLDDYAELSDYDTIFVVTTDLKVFLDQVFYVQHKKIILVTGCSVKSAPSEICSMMNIDQQQLLQSPNLVHWFTQNCDQVSQKVSPIPLGLDYHTLSRADHRWGHKSSAIHQEQQLQTIRASMMPLSDRPFRIYSNFHFKADRYNDRKECISFIKNNKSLNQITTWEAWYINREKSWKKHNDFAFILSPLGRGLDCHRTWEAICFGSLPIIKRSPLSEMFDDQPVIQVEHWNELSIEFLQNQLLVLKNRTSEKKHLNYWVNFIQMKKQ